MNMRLLFRAALGCTVAAPCAHAQMYGASPFQNQFYEIDIVNGTAITTQAVTVPGKTVTGINSVTFDPTTNIAYAVVKESGVSGRVLITIDPKTAVGAEVGNLGDNFSSITFDASGQMYGVTGDGATVPETLYLVDKATAAVTLDRGLGNGADGEVIAFNPNDGALYHWSGNTTVVYERLEAPPPFNVTITNIPISGTTSGETFGAVWDACQGLFITSNINSAFNTFTATGTVTPSYGAMPDDTRGLALYGGNTCNADLSVSLDTAPPYSEAVGPVILQAKVHSAGLARALTPILTIALPPSLTNAATTGCVEDPAGVPTCTLPTMFADENAVVAVTGDYDGNLGTASVSIATASNDPDPANNSATFLFGDRIFADGFE